MGLFKKGTYWHFDFIYKGKRHQGSTGQTNINLARTAEAKIRSNAALEHLGVGPPKESPTLKDFLEGDFLRFVERHSKARRTKLFYGEKVLRLLDSALMNSIRISDIEGSRVEAYVAERSRS